MRNKLIIASLFVLLMGCSDPRSFDPSLNQKSILDSYMETKSLGRNGENNTYVVNEFDLQNFVYFRQLEGKSRGKDVQLVSITPIEWEDMPCLYVIQYREGYEIISADKRSPIPIAANDRGVFVKGDDSDSFMEHLNLMAEQIWFSINGYGDKIDPEWEDEVNGSLDFWRMVNADSSFIEQNGERYIDPDAPIGHWEFLEASSFEVDYDTIPHLTVTQWYQEGIYNLYCPQEYTGTSFVRCPAGCAAIAGAQMLYYLHGKDGVPISSPTTGYCTGYGILDYIFSQSFTNPSPNSWSQMLPPRHVADTLAAILVGDVGKRLHTTYRLNGSSAVAANLVDSVFVEYGWNCSYLADYDASIIVSNLQAGYPVVCAASRAENRGVNKIRHAFLIDSYKRRRMMTVAYYTWIIDNPVPGMHYPPVPLHREVTYGSPYITHYRMNWGAEETSPNDTWCSLAGVWQYQNLPPYVYEPEMIYNFTL